MSGYVRIVLVMSAVASLGCATCSVASDPHFTKGLILGVLSLGAVLIMIMAFLVTFFFRLRDRSKKEEENQGEHDG
jgi:hypothetical protein